MTTRSKFIITFTAALAAMACDRAPEDAQRKATEAQSQANQTALQARQDQDQKVVEAQSEAAKQIEQARQEADHKVAAAQANANEDIREANLDISKARDDFRQWAQERLNELDNKMDDARAAMQKTKPEARAEFELRMRQLQLKRDELRADVQAAESQTASTWKTFKSRVEARVEELPGQHRQRPQLRDVQRPQVKRDSCADALATSSCRSVGLRRPHNDRNEVEMNNQLKSLSIGFVLLGSACASSPAPTEQLVAAQAAVRASQELGAAKLPQAQLHQQLAEEQIARARKLMNEGDNLRADMVLQRAKADAELSVALAREAATRQRDAQDMQEAKAVGGDVQR